MSVCLSEQRTQDIALKQSHAHSQSKKIQKVKLQLFIYLLIYYESRTKLHIKRFTKIKLQATNLRHTQVIDNKINVRNTQR